MTDRSDISVIALGSKVPRIHSSAFIAPGCRIIGDVEIGPDASIWYNCVLRGDVNRIVVGAGSNIQDGSVVHCNSDRPGRPGHSTIIGEDVLIGHLAMLHGCLLEDRAFVGMGAIVMDGCRIASDAMLAAGALLTPGKAVESGQLWGGRPARYMRDLTEQAIAGIQGGARNYVLYAQEHQAALDGKDEG